MISLDHPISLLHGDVLDGLRQIPDGVANACLTDPPYALGMGGGTAGWDDYSPASFARWCESWSRELVRILKPGGWLLSFGSGRTWHRMTCGVEDAGFDIKDSINWMYPASLRLSIPVVKRLAKAGSPERAAQLAGRGTEWLSRHEPAVLARAPLSGGLTKTLVDHGTATVDLSENPATTIAQHSPLCGGESDGLDCILGCPVPELGEHVQFFPTFRFASKPNHSERPVIQVAPGEGVKKLSSIGRKHYFVCRVCGVLTQSYMASGSVYSITPHPQCDHDSYRMIDENEFASTIAHNTVKPLSLMRWLVRVLTLPGDLVIEPFAGSGATVEACVYENRRCIAVERDLSSIELCRVRLRRAECWQQEDVTV